MRERPQLLGQLCLSQHRLRYFGLLRTHPVQQINQPRRALGADLVRLMEVFVSAEFARPLRYRGESHDAKLKSFHQRRAMTADGLVINVSLAFTFPSG